MEVDDWRGRSIGEGESLVAADTERDGTVFDVYVVAPHIGISLARYVDTRALTGVRSGAGAALDVSQ